MTFVADFKFTDPANLTDTKLSILGASIIADTPGSILVTSRIHRIVDAKASDAGGVV